MPGQPAQTQDHQYAGKNPAPARNAAQRLEIIQVDALREFLLGAYSSGHR
jgi:hypothetical protein